LLPGRRGQRGGDPINWRYLPEYPVSVGMGGLVGVIALLAPLWFNAGRDFKLRARIVGGIGVAMLAAMSVVSGWMVSPNNLLLAPAVMTFTLAIGWRTGGLVALAAFGAFTWNYTHLPPEIWAGAHLVDPTALYTALVMGVVFVFTGAMVFRRQMELSSRRLQAAKAEAEAAMRHYRNRAQTDALTGAANRLAFEEYLDLQIARAGIDGRTLSVVMLDLDHFKTVNDTHGHAAGDRVLIETARVARQCLREDDLFGRFGGEEFAIILPTARLREAAEIAERIRCAIAAMRVETLDGDLVPVTASFGVAQFGKTSEPRPPRPSWRRPMRPSTRPSAMAATRSAAAPSGPAERW
jgi:diguanylate cyclase (GGDEF)-like protein